MFKFIYNLIGQTSQDKANRITILQNKLVSFATTEDTKRIVLNWKNNQDENLKGVQMTIGQKWRAVVKAFTMNSLSLEEKEAIFEAQQKEDPSDTAKKYRYTCNGLKASEAEFEEIYQSFKTKDTKTSVSTKGSIAAGWNDEYHRDRLLQYRERYFKDVQ